MHLGVADSTVCACRSSMQAPLVEGMPSQYRNEPAVTVSRLLIGCGGYPVHGLNTALMF